MFQGLKPHDVVPSPRALRRVGVAVAAPAVVGLMVPAAPAQIADPVPGDIPQGDITVRVNDLARMPRTLGDLPENNDDNRNQYSRINSYRQTPGGIGYINDLRGPLYKLDRRTQEPIMSGGTPYMNLRNYFDDMIFDRAAAGFTNFTFHPDYENNGKFYTVHAEDGPKDPNPNADNGPRDLYDGPQADYVPPDFNRNDLSHHQVITEWTDGNLSDDKFAGPNSSRRELLRIGHEPNAYFHPVGDLRFDPTSTAAHPRLYIAGGNYGFTNGRPGRLDDRLQRLDVLAGKMLRIDPRDPDTHAGTKGIGDYLIPDDNPYAGDGDSDTLDEVYAAGFRNGHRISFDQKDGTLFLNDIGGHHIEEVNIIEAGGRYGWAEREGTFVQGLDDEDHPDDEDISKVYSINESKELDGDERRGPYGGIIDYNYPVAQYDHDEGVAISSGFVYRGDRIPELKGKYIFGDLNARAADEQGNTGSIFYADAAAMKNIDLASFDPDDVAQIYELNLVDENGDPITLEDMVASVTGRTRTDVRFGQTRDGEIVFTTKTDGFLRTFAAVPEPGTFALIALSGAGLLVRRRRRDWRYF